jgi:hypothetical protein
MQCFGYSRISAQPAAPSLFPYGTSATPGSRRKSRPQREPLRLLPAPAVALSMTGARGKCAGRMETTRGHGEGIVASGRILDDLFTL